MSRRHFRLGSLGREMIHVGLALGLALVSARGSRAEEPESWESGQLKKLAGEWVSAREHKSSAGVRRYDRYLEFVEGKMYMCVAEEGKPKSPGFTLTLIRVEQVEGAARLYLSADKDDAGALEAKDNRRASLVYFAVDGEKLIVVGNCPRVRPFEGGSLSGEYHRVEQPK
ncbi:MAG: hypothetical protein AB7O62_21135 [Pirellulales bacterium]